MRMGVEEMNVTDGTIEAAESPSPQTIEHALADGRVAVHDPAIAE